ncbi:hypothetical protein PIB30_069840 [Stylosanthes scabra]|uniref:SBP-type domain-containing protein n=1 Tax=Stylosanthes scabra TaxID=79078 RepID=A0ABU6ZM40_9FABA|nr:hypothetical protein [Stylosanthes scabra]
MDNNAPQVVKREAMPDDEDNNNKNKKKKEVVVVTCVGGNNKKGSGGGMRCCQAENCKADLEEARQYHRRHKVCEYHAKAQVVLVSGIRQRFCQQCSRFHELGEFDETKRSCRRRLAGHNERRRKNSESQAEGSSRKGISPHQLKKDTGFGDDRSSRIQIPIQENNNGAYKHFQIR